MRHPEHRDAGPDEFEPIPQRENAKETPLFTKLLKRVNLSEKFAAIKRVNFAEHFAAIKRGMPELRQALRGRYALVSVGLAAAVIIAALSVFTVTYATSTVVTATTASGDRDVAERADRHNRDTAEAAPVADTAEAAPAAIVPAEEAPAVIVEAEVVPAEAPAPPPPPPPPAPAWVAPMTKYNVTSRFEWRWGSFHDGYDLAGAPGDPAPILAAGAGTIETAWDQGDGYGIKVIINHGNGVKTLYGHLSAATVGGGQHVEPGQQIGKQGSTGFSTGYHLHFGTFVNGTAIDPSIFMSQRGVNLG